MVTRTISICIAAITILFCWEIVLRIWVLQPAVPIASERFFTAEKFFHPEFRYSEFTESKHALRILGLGDSFGTAKKEKDFFLNISIPALKVYEELQLLDRFGMRFNP